MTTRISRDKMLMTIAYAVALRSTCDRNHVGAVIVRDSRVISTGYNGAPSGMPHCDHTNDDQPCKEVVHAEANAIVFAARNGIATNHADLYTTLSPCVDCARLIINSGIGSVFFGMPYRDVSGIRLLESAGVACYGPAE